MLTRRVVLVLCLVLAVGPMAAQSHPLPVAVPAPFTFAGRYVDSVTTANFQHVGIRTIRARQMRLAGSTLYIQMGNAVGVYGLDSFFTTKLPGGLKSVSTVARGASRNGAPLEKLVVWDSFFYPESSASGWYVPMVDQQDPLGKGGSFDSDDRGLVYAGFPTFGWGIGRENGGGHLAKVVQMVGGGDQVDQNKYPNTRSDGTQVPPESVVSVKVGGRYYAVIAGTVNDAAVFDVTDPSSPSLLAKRTGSTVAMRKWDRSDALQKLVYIDGRSVLRVVTYQNLVTTGATFAYSGIDRGFTDVAFDDAGNIWATEDAVLWRITPAGAVTQQRPFPGLRQIRALAVGVGYLAVVGTDRSLTPVREDVRLLKIDGLRVIPSTFFRDYYHSPNAAYTVPCDLQFVRWGGKTYLLYSAQGLGDVYQLASIVGDPPVVTPPVPPVTPPQVCTCTCPCA